MVDIIQPQANLAQADPDQLQQQLNILADVFAKKLPAKLLEIEQAMQNYLAGCGEQPAQLQVLRRLLHSMAGSAGMFGFDEVGRRARELECLCDNLTPDSPCDFPQRVQAFLLWAGGGQKQTADSAQLPTEQLVSNVVFILAPDSDWLSILIRQVEQGGCEVWHVFDAAQLEVALVSQTPALLMLDLSEQPESCVQTVNSLLASMALTMPMMPISARQVIPELLAQVHFHLGKHV